MSNNLNKFREDFYPDHIFLMPVYDDSQNENTKYCIIITAKTDKKYSYLNGIEFDSKENADIYLNKVFKNESNEIR